MENIGFWAVALALAIGVAALLVLSLSRAAAEPAPGQARDLQVYRDQLAEVDRDLARGTLAEEEAQRLRVEISRRLLGADRALTTGVATANRRDGRIVPVLAILAALAGAVAMYGSIGVPWYPDMPLERRLALADEAMAERPSQAEVVKDLPPPPLPEDLPEDYETLMDQLRAAVDPATSTDLRGLGLLARNEAALGNFAAAEAAQRRVIAVKGEAATAEDHAGLAELLIRWAGGYISPEAEAELIAALQRDPQNGVALYYSGELFAQNGRFDRAYALWRPLYDRSPPDAPWMSLLQTRLAEVARLAGETWRPPEVRGPTGEDVAAAADMTPEERQAMIEGMVQQLADRLATEGGEAEEWAQLITALAALGRTDEARAIYAEAQQVFAGRSVELQGLRQAAVMAGVAE